MPTPETALVACTLTLRGLEDRFVWIAELARDALKEHRRCDLVLELTYTPKAADRVREMVRQEQTYCAFLTFDLREELNGVRLTVTAPEGARAIADMLFEKFVAGVSQKIISSCR